MTVFAEASSLENVRACSVVNLFFPPSLPPLLPLYSLSAGDNNGRRDRLSRSVRSFNVTDPCRMENRSWMEMDFAFA